MEGHNNEKPISNTSLAAYLKIEGFKIIRIEYTPSDKPGKKQGTFIFDATDSKIHETIATFDRLEAVGNIVKYQMARAELVDRVMRGLP